MDSVMRVLESGQARVRAALAALVATLALASASLPCSVAQAQHPGGCDDKLLIPLVYVAPGTARPSEAVSQTGLLASASGGRR